ncbi:hypothetical protein FB451DRAFT_1366360 [Mycena latifolia]|nr:hypothetical protein FB451DRAFT_1366360 [Mycena latifolia]
MLGWRRLAAMGFFRRMQKVKCEKMFIEPNFGMSRLGEVSRPGAIRVGRVPGVIRQVLPTGKPKSDPRETEIFSSFFPGIRAGQSDLYCCHSRLGGGVSSSSLAAFAEIAQARRALMGIHAQLPRDRGLVFFVHQQPDRATVTLVEIDYGSTSGLHPSPSADCWTEESVSCWAFNQPQLERPRSRVPETSAAPTMESQGQIPIAQRCFQSILRHRRRGEISQEMDGTEELIPIDSGMWSDPMV